MSKLVVDFAKIEGFDWDNGNKNKNKLKHTVETSECEELFMNSPDFLRDKQHSQIEERYIAYGKTNKSRKLFVSFTVRDNKIRVISARDQSKKEKQKYSL